MICVSGQWVFDTQAWNIGFEALSGNEFLLDIFICCPCIICCGMTTQTWSSVVFSQDFTLWVHHGFFNWWVGWDDIIEFVRCMGSISGCDNLNWCFEYKHGYSIFQFLVKKSTWTWLCQTCRFQITQKLPCCWTWYVLKWLYLEWLGKVPGARQLVLLAWLFFLFYFMIFWLPCNLSLKIRTKLYCY